ncbi:MAG: cyclodeaminase/cyclohydrolase family protein, partial [Candidatus Eremiobacteraeota bacterium]|nr:cyclodeaminase/cyclohydrolase family protein [Candidatus Eremiobacteraeota bacterium]
MESVESYLTELGSASATPGGGSAAMLVAATGAALLAMVSRIALENKKLTERHEAAARIARHADDLRSRFLGARKTDESAFEAVDAAQKRSKDDPERATALESALKEAADVPLQGAQLVIQALELAAQTARLSSPALISDVGCAVRFLQAA